MVLFSEKYAMHTALVQQHTHMHYVIYTFVDRELVDGKIVLQWRRTRQWCWFKFRRDNVVSLKPEI